MGRYAKEEILAVSQVARNLNEILDKIKSGRLNKVAISRNNKLESIIIPIKEYEKLQEIYELAEQVELHQMIKEREKTDLREYIPL